MPLYLHDVEVDLVGLSWWGTHVRDKAGKPYLVYVTGAKAGACLSNEPKSKPEGGCDNCDGTK